MGRAVPISELPDVVKHTWPVLLVWKLVSSITIENISAFRILLIEFEIAKTEGNYRKVMAKYTNPLVMILKNGFF